MQIRLTGSDRVRDQFQAYAQYRIFTSIARHEHLVRIANVTVREEASNRERFLCVVSLDLRFSDSITARARGAHPNHAIDRAADRLASLLGRLVPQHVSS